MKVLRIGSALAVLSVAICAPLSVEAGAKIIRVKPAGGAAAAKAQGIRVLRHGRHGRHWRYLCCVPLGKGVSRPYFHAPQPWNDRNYLRGPDFPPVNDRIQSHIQPGPTTPNAENIYRQRFAGGPTVRHGSIWAGRFRGGPTAEQGSPWRSRIGGWGID